MRQLIRQLVRVEAVAVVVIAWVVGAAGDGAPAGPACRFPGDRLGRLPMKTTVTGEDVGRFARS
jgi:hypothetical protein